ncbi:aldo/keto reductase [Leuconostoc gelidum]|uniref:aldo/keto reductase n=1 Tax=Leuconostoc gelidum TaxID=1244 RepID=UPI001CC6A184|nr:aldo/keto reductase [Leuconostoc gelidum]
MCLSNSDENTSKIVERAIVSGYNLINAAEIYSNEVSTGIGIKNGLESAGLNRDDIFITSKVWQNPRFQPQSSKFKIRLFRAIPDSLAG